VLYIPNLSEITEITEKLNFENQYKNYSFLVLQRTSMQKTYKVDLFWGLQNPE